MNSKNERTETAELTVLCLVYNKDSILLQNRVKDDWKGYTLPGGHIEKHEDVSDAVKREVLEETGLVIKDEKLCGIKHFETKNGRYIVFLYKTNNYSGTLTSSSEGEMVWVKRSEVSSYNLVPDFFKLLEVMECESLNEFVYKKSCFGLEAIVK